MGKKRYVSIKVVLSVIFTILFQMDVNMHVPPRESFYGKDRVAEILLLLIFYYSFSIWENKRYCYKKWGLIIASILAAFYTWGYNIDKYLDVFSTDNGDWIIGKLFLKWLVCWYCFSTVLLLSYSRFDGLRYWPVSSRIKHISRPIRQICIVLLFISSWLPRLVSNFPGVIYGDSWNQIYQAIGMEHITTHHPIVHTLLLKLCLSVGSDMKKGVAVYTIVSAAVIIYLLSYVINLMIEEDFDIRIIAMAIVIYVFFPSISMFTITITKDSWFAAFVSLFLMELYVVVVKGKKKTRYWIGLTIASMGVGLFRKNGIYLLAFTGMYLCIYIVKHKVKMEKVLLICIFAVCLHLCVEKSAISFLSVESGSPREMLSLPIQQMARIEKNGLNTDNEMRERIDSFFRKNSDLAEAYNPLISDDAKNLFSEKQFSNREKEFVALSLRLLVEYPEETLEALMCSSFGYWYPIPINWFYVENSDKELNMEETVRKHEYPLSVNYVYFNELKNIADIDIFTSLGMVFWLFAGISGYLAANKRYGEMILLVPMFALWLTSVASPVYNELRYVLAIYPALPVICQLLNERGGKISLIKASGFDIRPVKM